MLRMLLRLISMMGIGIGIEIANGCKIIAGKNIGSGGFGSIYEVAQLNDCVDDHSAIFQFCNSTKTRYVS